VANDVLKIFNTISLPILLIDRDYRIAQANQAAFDHLKLSPDKIIGQSCFAVTHRSTRPCWQMEKIRCPVQEAFANKRRVHSIHLHPVQDRHIVEELIATPIDAEDGEIKYVVEEIRDLTALLELQEGVLPICASCKQIRDLKGTWYPIESYLHDHTGADFSHSLCPTCIRRLYPDILDK